MATALNRKEKRGKKKGGYIAVIPCFYLVEIAVITLLIL
jgi:hypothetical protein